MITPTHAIAAALAVASLALAVFPVAAVDGEILIDQAKVVAGGITPGDAAGFPATLSRPGRYKLSSNLVVPALVNGIEVTAKEVTIDLNGFTIRSNPPGEAASGIVALGPGGDGLLRVMNGTVTGFSGSGIIKSPGLGVIENMRIISNGSNLELADESQVRNSTIANSNSSFPDPNPGVRCFGMCLIENNVITGNIGAGVSMEADGSAVLGNVIVGNGSAALLSSGWTGYGNNMFINNGSAGQVSGLAFQLHPNVCNPACP